MGAQQRRGEPSRSATPGRNSQGSHMSSIVLPPSQWPTDTRRDGIGGTSAKSRPASGGAQNRPGTAGSSRARAQSAERVRPRSASSAGRSIPESPVRRPRVRDIPKMYYELPQSPPIEAKVYRPPFWSEDTWGTAECVSPKELNKRGLTRTLSGKNLTLRTRSLNLVSLGEKEKEMKEVMKTRRTLHEGDKQALQRTFRAVARTMVCRVTLEEFVEAWALLGVEVSKEEAASFFHVYGMDKQGLMPYQVFTNALLTLPAKMRGMGAIRRGAFEKDEQKEFLGKIMYAKCKTGVFAPSDWNPALGERSAQPPKASMRLEWVQGYSGHNNVSPNLFYTANGDMVYYAAAVGIVYNKTTHSQKFFLGHTDDIMCLAIHPDRNLVATGQNGVVPFVCVWDTRDQCLVRRIDYEEGMCAIVCAAFSPDGRYLAAVATDNNHTIFIHDWAKGTRVWTGRGAAGEPPQVFGVCWSPFHPNVWASYGVKHLKFWRLRDGTWQEMTGAYGRSAQPFNILSCVFLPSGTVLAGTLDGQISVWADGKLQYLVDAHTDASKLTQMTGAKRQRGLRCITLRSDKTTLLSAGSDGFVHQWDVSSGTLPRNARPINRPGFLSHVLRSPHKGERLPTIKGLDCQVDNDNDTFIVGTSKCEIWEVGDESAEVLIHGHTDDIYTAEWHPKLPNLYVSACESGRVYVWDAMKRRLLRTCQVGFPCRSVAIQPGSDNPHIAVGGKGGQTCVVRFSNLEPLFTWKDCANSIDDLKYSPDGSKLATASHDLVIDLYNARDSYTHIARCHGHSATVSHVDWSADGSIMQTNCNDYEILYWDARTGRKVTSSMRDVDWATWTCVLGFPVMGIWRTDMDGTDINSCDRSRSRQYLVTADDFGRVSLMNYPAVVQHAPVKVFTGHSSHVQNVRFSPDDARVISAGSHDRAVFQWRTHAIRRNANGTIASDPDPLCTEEDCAACGTRPAPPPPPRVWGALDDSGLHFGWVRNDGTGRWSRRTSTLVEEEDTESDFAGDEEGGGQAESGAVGGSFASRDRLAVGQGPGQAGKQGKGGVPQQAGENNRGGFRGGKDADEYFGERVGGGSFASSDRLAPEQGPKKTVREVHRDERRAEQRVDGNHLPGESFVGGGVVSENRIGRDQDLAESPKQERRSGPQVEETIGGRYRDERRFEQQAHAGDHSEEHVFASRDRLPQGQAPGHFAEQGRRGAQQAAEKAGGVYREERRLEQQGNVDGNLLAGNFASREPLGPGQAAGQGPKQQRGGVQQAGEKDGGIHRDEVRVGPQEDVKRMIQRNDPEAGMQKTDDGTTGGKAGWGQGDRSSGVVGNGYSREENSARPVESEPDWSRAPQKEGFGRDGYPESPGNAYQETRNAAYRDTTDAARPTKGRQAHDEERWASDQDTRSRPPGNLLKDSGGYPPANNKSEVAPASPSYPRVDDSRSRPGVEPTGNPGQRRQAPDDARRDPQSHAPPADFNRPNASQPAVSRPVDNRNASRARGQNPNSPSSGAQSLQPGAFEPTPSHAAEPWGTSQAVPGQQYQIAPQPQQGPGVPVPGGWRPEQRNDGPQRRPVEQSFEVHDEMLEWGGEEVDEEIEEV